MNIGLKTALQVGTFGSAFALASLTTDPPKKDLPESASWFAHGRTQAGGTALGLGLTGTGVLATGLMNGDARFKGAGLGLLAVGAATAAVIELQHRR